jgi:aryl-alcohol dehydrogenase-like predicted oxidoreductase
LKEIASEAGMTLTEMALAWCLHQPQVSSAIIGATRIEHVEENARAGDIELPEDVLASIDAIAPA